MSRERDRWEGELTLPLITCLVRLKYTMVEKKKADVMKKLMICMFGGQIYQEFMSADDKMDICNKFGIQIDLLNLDGYQNGMLETAWGEYKICCEGLIDDLGKMAEVAQ